MRITSSFDGGNIVVKKAETPGDIQLEIAKDAGGEFYQWFYFRLSGVLGQECVMKIGDLAGSAYPDGWPGYQACASYDREAWFRIDAGYENGVLTIRHKPAFDSLYIAYFAPYSMERHADLIAGALVSPLVRHEVLGETLDGQDIDLLIIGEEEDHKKKCWIIGRQHPGETMAEWWMEGCIDRLLDEADPVGRALLEKAVFYVAPNMNPDGSRRGHLRTNAAGANLNREWDNPTAERSPEVLCVRNKMDKTGLDFCLDVHGDEALPYNFIAGFEGIPSITEAQLGRLNRYKETLARVSPDFQIEKGYPVPPPGKANLSMATNQIAERYGALAMTLEMPFKDTSANPDPLTGWSPDRCAHLARACLDTLYALVDDLR